MRQEAAFQGSMYSSIRCSSGRDQAKLVSAVSAWAASPRPRLRGAMAYPAEARPAAMDASHKPDPPTASSVSPVSNAERSPAPVARRSCWRPM